ncbi:hypothetical protein [Hymenobacter psoromatis]|uniref:hypothetical protein n=1 Tax=Hymenobacter psoromatis TaxID=1484116 RepID=UPI001CBFC0FA|nr:hypothetical protein [Hymenobacter psoromatis]
MKFRYHAALLALGTAPLLGRAQQLAAPLAEDTVGHLSDGFGQPVNRFYLGTLTKTDGTQIRAYMPYSRSGYENRIDYYAPPLSIDNQLRHRHAVKVKDIQSIAVHGRTFEAITIGTKKADVLALHLFDGPITLSTYSEPRAISIPLALGAFGGPSLLFGIPVSDKSHWYLYRNGVWTEIRRAAFAATMSAYLFDNPELAAKVARQEPNYLHQNTPVIIAEYNQAKVAGGK